MSWSEDSLKARIKEILEDRAGNVERVKTFMFDVAMAADSSVSSVDNWRHGRNLPDAASLLNLLDNLPGFERELRGANGDRHQERTAELENLLDRIHEMSDRSNVVRLPREGSAS